MNRALVWAAIFMCAIILSCATGGRIVTPPQTIQGAEYVGMDNCSLCHEKITQSFAYTNHARLRILGAAERVEGQGCEICHGAGSLHMDVGGGRGVHIINPGKNPAPCFQCHPEIKAAFNLPYHHPLKEGRMSCNDCHDPHGQDIYSPKGVFVARENETCRQCHPEQARPRVFEHEALREGCTSCHGAHGSINEKMLTERDNNLCLKCHAQIAAAGTVTIGDFSHTGRVMEGPCWSAGCHTAVHGSDINAHLRY